MSTISEEFIEDVLKRIFKDKMIENLEEFVANEADIWLEDIKRKILKKAWKEVDKMVLEVLKLYDIEKTGDRLVITVKKVDE